MEFSSKQRAQLRSISSSINTKLNVGKNGISDTVLKQLDDALEASEIVKCKVFDNCPMDIKSVAIELAKASNSEVVQVIGRKVVFYRRNKKKPIINI